MSNNENKSRPIKLRMAFGLGDKEILPSHIRSIISLSPFVCDVRTMDVPYYEFTVEHSLIDILKMCEEVGYPIFKSTQNIGSVKKILDVQNYRKMNFE